jgi:putative peptidoglycan lipid II flippase
MAGGSTLVAAGILLSRLSGLVREKALAAFLGLSGWSDAFSAASRLPNLVQNLLGEGTLSASFIPAYSRAVAKGDPELSGRLAGVVLGVLTVLAGGLALLGVVAAPLLVAVFVPGFEGDRQALTIEMVRLMFPMTGVLVVSAWALGILNSHRRFFLSYAAPVAWNACIVLALAVGSLGLDLDPRSLALAAAWGALAGGVVQLLVQLPAVFKLEPGLRPSLDLSVPGATEVLTRAGPAILGRGVVQFSGYLDMILASLLAVGAPTALRFAQTLYTLPISLFGMSVAAAELPELSRAGGADTAALASRTRASLERQLFLVVPSAVALAAIGEPIVAALYQDGAFTADHSRVVWLVLLGYDLGLVASATSRLLQSSFYALSDTATPARAAGVRVLASAAIGLGLMAALEPLPALGWAGGPLTGWTVGALPLGAAGLAAGTGVAAWLEWWWLRRALSARLTDFSPRASVVLRNLGASLAGAAAGLVAHALVPDVHPVLRAGVIVGAFGVAWLGAAMAAGLEGTEAVLRRLRRR